MAKSIKKGLMVLLTCALVFFGAAAMFFAENAVYAEASVNMQYGASVRIRGDGTGIRFTAFVDESLLDINEEGASFKQDVTVGMIVVPAKVLENAVGDVIAYIGSSFNKEKSEFAYEFSDEQIRKITEATENGSVTKYAVSAAIVNITDSNVNLEYQAVPYVFDGENYTYGDMSEKRTISYVLESALKSDGYSDEQKNIILGETIRIHNEQAMTLTTDSSIENGCDLSAFASSDKVIDSALVGETAVTVKENKISGEYLAPGDNEIKITYADGSKITLSTDTDPVMHHADATEYKTASSSQFFEKAYAQRVTSGYIAKYRIKSAGLASSDKTSGNVTYFNTWTNTDGSGTYKTNYGVMLMFDGNGLKLYGWSNSGWVNRNYYFTAEQKTVMSESGIDMIFTFDGKEFAVWVATSSAEMKKVMIAPVSETIYVVGHKGEVYSGNPDITVSEGVYNCKGQTSVQSITGLYGNLYTTVNDSFIYLLNSKAETKFENLSSNSEFESAYAAPRPNEGYFARYTVKSSDLATSSSTSGNVIYFNTWTNTDGSAWTANNSVNYGVMLMFDGNGLKLYGWSNSGWVNRNYYFTAEQLSMFGADGIDVITAHDGKTFKVYVEVSEGVIYEVMEAPAEGRYIVAHKHAVYTGHDLSVSLETYGYTGYTLESALEEVYPDKYEITTKDPHQNN